MVEYSLPQLFAVCGSIMDFCKQECFTAAELDRLRIQLHSPDDHGEIPFDLSLPLR